MRLASEIRRYSVTPSLIGWVHVYTEWFLFGARIIPGKLSQTNLVIAIAADALAPCVGRPSACKVLTMQGKKSLDFHDEQF